MNEELIRKAVKLANGWEWNSGFVHVCLHPVNGSYEFLFNAYEGLPEQWHLDALAAQLVRQVDELESCIAVYIEPGVAKVGELVTEGFLINVTHSRGPDRTINTIRAIVESEVLDESRSVARSAIGV